MEGRKGGRPPGQGNKGEHYVPHPVDFAILENLPPEGQMLGWHVIAQTAKRLTEDLNKGLPEEAQITNTQLTGRLVSMASAGLLVKVPIMGSGGRIGWQRSAKGAALFKEHTGKTLPSASEGTTTGGGN